MFDAMACLIADIICCEWSTSLVPHNVKAMPALSKNTASIDLSTALPLAVTSGGKPPIQSTQHMCCWAVQSGLRIDGLFPVSFALPKDAVMLDDLASGVPFTLGRGWVLGITSVRLEPEQQPKAANPLSLLILFLSASSPCHHAALSGLRGQLREETHVTQHQTKTKQKPSSVEH